MTGGIEPCGATIMAASSSLMASRSNSFRPSHQGSQTFCKMEGMAGLVSIR
jgi:hypothetical protein